MAGVGDQVELEVVKRLDDLTVDQLHGLWDSLQLPEITDPLQKENKIYLIKQIIIHLMGDEVQGKEDNGMAIFLTSRDYINKHAPKAPLAPLTPEKQALAPGSGKAPLNRDDAAKDVLARHKVFSGVATSAVNNGGIKEESREAAGVVVVELLVQGMVDRRILTGNG